MSRSNNIFHPRLALRKLPAFSHEQERIRWFEKNKSRLLKGAGGFFAVVVCGFLIIAYQRHQNFLAREKLRLGIAALQAGKLEEAIPSLENAKDLFGSGERAQVANFYLTEAYVRHGQLDRIKDLAAPHGSLTENAYLSQIILLTQGRSAEKQKDQITARKLYEGAAALVDGPLTTEALLGIARVAESTGDTTAANAAREKFLAAYPNSLFADMVRQKLDKERR